MVQTKTLPNAPQKGLVFWVQTGGHWSMGNGYTVGPVNGRSFYIYTGGQKERFLLSEWNWWVDQRLAEGRVFYEGREYVGPGAQQVDEGDTVAELTVDLPTRDARFLRAAGDVLKNYKLKRNELDDGSSAIEINGGHRVYTVNARKDWAIPPTCSCPDAERRARSNGGFCKHVIAVCIAHRDLRCQLLDLLL
jgi:hypothetical protein